MEIFVALIGSIIGIIMGLYLNTSIVFIFIFITLIYILSRIIKVCIIKFNKYKTKEKTFNEFRIVKRDFNKYKKAKSKLNKCKIIRYIRILIHKKLIYIFITFIIIFNIYTIYLEKYYNTYKNVTGNVKVIGVIIDNGVEKDYKVVYTIKVISIDGNEKYKNTKLLLNVKKSKNKQIDIKYGDLVSLTGEIEEPTKQRNYGGFNYKEYLKNNKIHSILNTTSNNIKVIKKDNVNIILMAINSVGLKIQENANKLLEKDEASLLTGILIGNKDNLSDNIKENFRNSNLSHMLAVSGAHVSYIILGLTFILSKSKINKKLSNIILIFILIFFMILTGASPSVVRSCIMSIYILVAHIIYKKPDILISISISAIILLLENPYNLFNLGFLLSYGGTIGIIIFVNRFTKLFNKKNKNNNKLIKIARKVIDMFIVTLSANIIIFPIIAYNFSTISATFFISNILAGPILGFIIIIGFITIIISFISIRLSSFVSIILSFLLKLIIFISELSSNLPFSKIYIKTPSIFKILLYYIVLIVLLNRNRFRRIINKIINRKNIDKNKLIKKVISIILIFIMLIQLIKIIPQNLLIHFIDVGQGDSMLVITPNHKTILIDGGGSKEGESFDVGEKTLLPYLLDREITKIDYCIITHFDADHVRWITNNYERT